jgi:hypothetical protein
VASGSSGAGRRLERSRLLASARRIADTLAGVVGSEGPGDWADPRAVADAGGPVETDISVTGAGVSRGQVVAR